MGIITERIKVYKGEKGKRKSQNGKWADFTECPYCGESSYFSMTITDGMKGRGKIKACDIDGNEMDTDSRSIALYYCPSCCKFNVSHK